MSGRSLPLAAAFFDEPLVQGSPRAKRPVGATPIFVDDVEEGVGRLELHLASVKLLETSDEEDTTTGDYMCATSASIARHAGVVLFFDIAVSQRSRRWRLQETAVAKPSS